MMSSHKHRQSTDIQSDFSRSNISSLARQTHSLYHSKNANQSSKQKKNNVSSQMTSASHFLLGRSAQHFRGSSCNVRNMFDPNENSQHSHKPEIHGLPESLYPNARQNIELSRGAIFERLVNNLKEKQTKNKLLKMEKQEKQFSQNCSFKPYVNETSKRIAYQKQNNRTEGDEAQDIQQNWQDGNHKGSNALFDRLYLQGKQKLLKKISKEYQQTGGLTTQEKSTQQCSFKPEINPVSKKIIEEKGLDQKPLHLRVDQMLREKLQLHKLQLHQNLEKLNEQTSWKISNKVTLNLLRKSENQGKRDRDVVNRLLKDYLNQKQTRKIMIEQQQQERFEQLCPFKPTLVRNLTFNESLLNAGQQDFLQRQTVYQQNAKENLFKKANQSRPTFQPEINKISQLITKNRESQSLEQKLNRLNYESYVLKEQAIDKLGVSVYKECTFKPKINEISKTLDTEPKSHSCNCSKKPEQYSFNPKINKKSKQMMLNQRKIGQNFPDGSVNTQIQKKQRQSQINKIKMQQEYKSLKQCTFQPKTNKSLNKDMLKENLSNAVSGIKSYLQKSELIKRKKSQNEMIKERLFNLQKRYKPKKHTKIQQFKLTRPCNSSMKNLNEQERSRKGESFTPNCKLR